MCQCLQSNEKGKAAPAEPGIPILSLNEALGVARVAIPPKAVLLNLGMKCGTGQSQ